MDTSSQPFDEKTPPRMDRRQDRSDERALWGVAAQLAGGMLANDARSHFTVKDSLALFDEVLHDLVEYARVRGEFGIPSDGVERGRELRKAAAPEPPAAKPLVRKAVPLPGEAPVAAPTPVTDPLAPGGDPYRTPDNWPPR